MVQEEGVEPSRPKTLGFESSAAASYATPACHYNVFMNSWNRCKCARSLNVNFRGGCSSRHLRSFSRSLESHT